MRIFITIILLVCSFASHSQFQFDEWERLPTDSEIKSALSKFENENYLMFENENITREASVSFSSIIKFFDKIIYQNYHKNHLSDKYAPYKISHCIVFYEMKIPNKFFVRKGILGMDQTNKTFVFYDDYIFYDMNQQEQKFSSAQQATTDFISNLSSNNYEEGFAPALGEISSETSLESTTAVTDIDGIVSIDDTQDSDIPWTVIVGTLTAAALAAIARKIFKKGAKSTSNNKSNKKPGNKKDEKDEEKKEEAHYVLQLNKEHLELSINRPENLSVLVYKVTPTSQNNYPADIQINSPDSALEITPNSGVGSINSQLLLRDSPKNQNFTIIVSAQADGHQFQKEVFIKTAGEKNLSLKTADNKKSLRPDTFQVLTCFACITDDKGKTIPDLTEKIRFEPKNDWIDLSKPELQDDNAIIYIGSSNPNPNRSSTPPQTVVVSVVMDDVGENEKPLRQDLEISLVDCRLETQIEVVTIPETDEVSEVTFWARIESAGDEIGWSFKGEYRHGIEPTEPLTDIVIDKKNETEVNVTLRGPLMKLGETENQISKTLVISAYQEDEKPIERHITVIVSREGLFIKRGVNKNNEINFIADKPFEEYLEFALNVYDEHTNQIVVDTNALKNLEFEFLNEEKEMQNLVSVLLVGIEYIDLVTNIPYGKYKFSTQADFPGFGDIHTLKFKVKAPVQNVKNAESFEKIIYVNIKSYGIGSEFPDWEEAYEDCLYILNNYVPKGIPYNKLSDLLEMRKMTLGAEGLKELRNRMWKIGSDLILAEGAEGYKSEARWASAIESTLEVAEWAGDIAFSALAAFATGGLGATVVGVGKGGLIDALKFYFYEPDKTLEDFFDMQINKFIPLLMNMAKGRLLSMDNIELLVKNNKPLAWSIYICTEFLYQLYQTKSVYEAGKLTAKGMVEELMIQKLTKKLHQEAMNRKIGYKSPTEVFDDIIKNTKEVNGETVLDQKKLLELMRDPESVRTIKNHGTPEVKKIFESARNKIYKQHDAKLKDFIKQKYGIPESDIVIDDFRTPGSDANSVNTDRDYRVLRKVTKADGSTQYIELQRPNWVEQSYEIFGEVTGKPKELSHTEWAEKHQQRGTDRFDAEASSDYSDHTYNPKTGEVEVVSSNIKKVKSGETTLINAEEMGNMYKNKVDDAVKNGTIPEAYAQLQKSIKTLEDVRSGYGKQNLDIPEMDTKLKTALAYAKKIKTDVTGALDPQNVKNMENQIKSMTGYDLNKMTQEIDKNFKALKKYDKGVPL